MQNGAGGGLAAAEGEVLAADLSTDVAVIRVEAHANAVTEMGEAELPQLGQSVAIIGRLSCSFIWQHRPV